MVSPLKTTVTDKPRIVLVFGVFDLLHPGHIAFLKIAKSYGDRLVVVVTRDKRAELEKGQRPVYKLTERMLMLQALDCVDEALPGDIDGQWNMVKNIAPHVICIGHDQSKDHPKFLAQLKELKQLPRIVQLPSFNRKRYSTSRLRELMLDNR
ncbi:adenylyltransferase/cytidyltransferase family protein [Patescibacteria group bacterium]|nr:adenylyltransferase/cytidyltransferase family protein [Patescibacteria group bacterium]